MNKYQLKQLKELLKIHFGYDSFLPGQERALNSIMAGNNTIVVLPTGGGKSLIYQLPALIMPGVTVVISPLIALMKDQVDSLLKIGVPATFINSSLSLIEADKRLEQLSQGDYKIVYIAPERFYNQKFLEHLKKIKVSLFAIDEAHCISQWGHDFRPSYLRLAKVIEFLGKPPVVALTATATQEVREDIAKQLNITKAEMIVTGFARPNLHFAVITASNREKIENIVNLFLTNPDLGSGIIYVGTRAKAEEILEVLIDHDIKAVAYHAGLDVNSRNWVQEQFMNGNAQVVVATNAFGLGINKADIRFVIHHDLPSTIEAYYQEAGRAGRDGQTSFCLLFYHPQDRYLREFFIKGDNPDPRIIIEIYDFLLRCQKNQIADNSSLFITYADIIKNLSEAVPEMAIGTALKILERESYISRPKERRSNSFLKLNVSWPELISSLSPRAKKQQEIMTKLQEKYGSEIMSGWEFNSEEISLILHFKKESLIRTLKKLAEKELLNYRPPWRGTEIKILKIVEPEDLELDFKALKKKAARAYEKLAEMENYIHYLGCRQEYILNYFGDNELKACGHCDNCLKQQHYQTNSKKNYLSKEYLVNY